MEISQSGTLVVGDYWRVVIYWDATSKGVPDVFLESFEQKPKLYSS